MAVRHVFVSPYPDDGDPTLVRPTNWNSQHAIAQTFLGNTAGVSTLSDIDMFWAAAGVATLSVVGNSVSIVVPAGGGALTNINVSASNASANLSNLVFSNSNGMAFGLNGSTITASYTQSGQAFSAANGSSTFSTLSFNNANGAQWSNNGGAIELSYTVPTVPPQTNQTGGIYASSQTTGQSSSSTYDARSLSFVFSNQISGGWTNGSFLFNVTTAAQTVDTARINAIGNTTGQSSSSTYDLRTLNISGAGIASVGWSAGSLIFSVPSGGGAAFSAGVSNIGNTSGDTGVTGTRYVFAGGNNITLSQVTDANGATMTISGANAGGAQTGISGLANSQTTYTSGSVTFSELGAITIRSTTGQQFQFSVNPQTVQSLGIYASSQTTGQSSSSTYDARSLSFVFSNQISGGWTNGSFLFNVTTAAQTSQSAIKGLGVSNTGNTAGNTGLSTGIDWVIAGSNNITASQSTAVGGPNTIWISGPSVGGAQTGISGIQVSDTTYTSGTVTFRNANGISFGSSGANGISASYTVPNVPAQTVQTLGIYASSQTTGQSSSSTYDARSLSFVFSNNISGGWTNGSFLFNVTTAAQTVQTLGIYASSQTTGQSSSSTHDARSLSMVGSGNISIGWSNSSLIFNVTTAAQTNQTAGIYMLGNTTGQSSSSTYDARTLSFTATGASMGWSNGSVIVSVTQSNQAFSAGGGASNFQTLSFADTRGMSWTNTNGSVGLASLNLSLFAVSNTTQSSSGTANHSALSFGGAGVASVGVTGGTVLISVPSAGAVTLSAYAQSNTTQSSSGTLAGSSLMFAGAGIASVGISNGSVVVSVPSGGGAGDGGVFAGVSTFGNTAGSTGTVSTGNFVLVGSGAISLSQSTGAAGSAATVSILAPATSSLVGASGVNVSTNGSTISVYHDLELFFQNQDYFLNSQTQTVQQSTSVVFPFFMKQGQTADFARMFHTVVVGSTSFASTANTSYSYQQAETYNLVVYTRGSGASSLSLQSYFSTSVGFTMSARLSRNTTNNISVSHGYTYPVSNGTSSISFSYAATNSTDQFSSTGMSALSGMKQWDTQFAKTFLPGRYWLAYGVSTAQTTQQTNASGLRLQHSHLGISQANNTIGFFGSAVNASIQWQLGVGSFSTNAIATTASIPLANISSSASHVVPLIQMMRIA